MDALLHSTNFWVIFSTIVFLYVAWRFARVPLLNLLDNRSDRIRAELDEAERLRVEAQQLLTRYERQHEEAMQEAKQIVSDARKQALDMQNAAEAALKADIARKHKQFEERLGRMEQAAIEDVRDRLVEISMAATEDLLKKTLSSKQSAAAGLNDDMITGLEKNLKKKSA
ncbi:MAG: ATP F0F1 synthase subunit B [Pseudomonadota bacterium]|jgi:F-type H+-transporting ATPase subunit b|nr:ATP F0F1 synthase subunit B [Pseudomonadota bacterium]QKK05067.1 MAG: ATP F0F1 synthase subunit B [Pseudomonadota bacterium]|tara:strand:- start:6 stop:515 length:510 start_codon:yes stop_codon:yes gene_type:complete